VQHCGADRHGPRSGVRVQSRQHRLNGRSFNYDPHFKGPVRAYCHQPAPQAVHDLYLQGLHMASIPRHATAADPHPGAAGPGCRRHVWPCTEPSPDPHHPVTHPGSHPAPLRPLAGSVACRSLNHTPVLFCLLFFLFVLHFETVLALWLTV